MGHAQYAQGGTDFDMRISFPFTDVDEVLRFDPYAVYGVRSKKELTEAYNQHFLSQKMEKPDQVVMTGIYITMVSGLLEIFGWNVLLSALGENPDAFGETANRYADWIGQYFGALAESEADVVMVHDDIVWTSGPFANPKWYRKYVFPNYEKLFAPLHKAGKCILYTSYGTYDAFADDVAACGVNGFVMEPTTDLVTMVRKFGKTHALVGDADCRILTFGSQEEIQQEVKRCMDLGRDCPGFVMAVGNHIPANVPVENALYYNDCYLSMADRW